MPFRFYSNDELCFNDKSRSIYKRLLKAIHCKDISFIKKYAPMNIPDIEMLVNASLYSLDNETIIWLIQKYYPIMNMNILFDYVVKSGNVNIAKYLYEKKMGIWSFEAVRCSALAGDKEMVEWCTNIIKPNNLEYMALMDALFKGGTNNVLDNKVTIPFKNHL